MILYVLLCEMGLHFHNKLTLYTSHAYGQKSGYYHCNSMCCNVATACKQVQYYDCKHAIIMVAVLCTGHEHATLCSTCNISTQLFAWDMNVQLL
jgi:hypothetical protein